MERKLKDRIKLKGLLYKCRLSDLPVECFTSILSKSHLKKSIKRKSVFLNGTLGATGDYVYNGDVIEVFEDDIQRNEHYNLKLKVSYEDDYLAVVDKPPGLIVSGNKHRTLENALPLNITPSTLMDRLTWARPVHRLDSVTSGLIIIAKTKKALNGLYDQFKNRSINKYYLALIDGKIPEEGIINVSIKGKTAKTTFRLLDIVESDKYGPLSFAEVSIQTGRTHQIRIHFSETGHPIVGDNIYNHRDTSKVKGLYLHAWKVEFNHPITLKRISVLSSLPKKFKLFGIKT